MRRTSAVEFSSVSAEALGSPFFQVKKKIHRIKILREINKLVQLRDQRSQRSASRGTTSGVGTHSPLSPISSWPFRSPPCGSRRVQPGRLLVCLIAVFNRAVCTRAQGDGSEAGSPLGGSSAASAAERQVQERLDAEAEERDRLYTTEHKLLFDTVRTDPSSVSWTFPHGFCMTTVRADCRARSICSSRLRPLAGRRSHRAWCDSLLLACGDPNLSSSSLTLGAVCTDVAERRQRRWW